MLLASVVVAALELTPRRLEYVNYCVGKRSQRSAADNPGRASHVEGGQPGCWRAGGDDRGVSASA
eukprot:1913272-Pyramimonas_sp.AAC.1